MSQLPGNLLLAELVKHSDILCITEFVQSILADSYSIQVETIF